MTPWDATVLALVALGGGWLVLVAIRRGALWWQWIALLAGLAIAIGTIVSPLDRWGREWLLASHLGQHVLLSDLAAALILLGLPPSLSRALRIRLERLRDSPRAGPRVVAIAFTPLGALALWSLSTYFWLLPPVHRAAAPGGPVHALDHVVFIGIGALVWLAVFDPRRPRPWRRGLREGGLPWWARHLYSMVSRLAIVPPAIAIWATGSAAYHDLSAPWPFPITRTEDQELAASVMIGFEMIVFAVSMFFAFIFLIVASNRAGPHREPW